MKVVQTFWTGNVTESQKRSVDIRAGWPTAEFHWMSWALSCLQARSLFGQVELVTDDLGKEILIDRLGLPYSRVSTALEGALQDYPSQVWALAKIFSYSIQTEPFLHIDGDVYLWERPDKRIMEAGIISQNLEKDLFFYKASLDGINEVFSDLPPIYRKEYYENKAIYSGNAGLIGGNDLEFFAIYCKEAFEFVDANKKDFGKVNPANLQNLNFLFEQYALYHIALRESKPITFYLEKVIETPVYEDLIRFQDRPFVKMIHPVGKFKRQLHLCDHLAQNLRSTYPAFYYRIVDWVRREGIPMSNKIYYSAALDISGLGEIESPGIIPNPYEVYERTLSAITILNAGDAMPDALQIRGMTQNELRDRIKDNRGDRKENELIIDLHYLEQQKDRVFGKAFDHACDMAAVYKSEARTYESLQKGFALGLPEMLQLRVTMNEDALLIETGWAWQYEGDDTIKPIDVTKQVMDATKQMMEKNLGAERSSIKVALVPNVVRVSIYEYYFDHLDTLIVETIKSGKFTIGTLTEDIKQYFDPDEIEANPSGLFKLVIDILKRLCYGGVVEIHFAE